MLSVTQPAAPLMTAGDAVMEHSWQSPKRCGNVRRETGLALGSGCAIAAVASTRRDSTTLIGMTVIGEADAMTADPGVGKQKENAVCE